MDPLPRLDPLENYRGYRIFERRVSVAGREYVLVGPVNYESLLDDPRVQERFRQDEFMPYWAEFWPAAMLLAELVAAWGPAGECPDAPRLPQDACEPAITLAREDAAHLPTSAVPAIATDSPPRVLELGAGLGLVGLVAHRLGYPTTISDYDDDALAFIAESARRSGLAPVTTRFVDWRETYPELISERIVAVEVLYERRNLPAVAAFLQRHLTDDGVAWICDGNRQVADGFPDLAARCGLRVSVTARQSVNPLTGKSVAGRIFEIRRDHP